MHMPNSYEQYRDTKFFLNLNGLRFICIAMVLWHHGWQVWDDSSPMLLKRGFFGVAFFFVLSGYLITTLLLRERDRDGQFSLKRFYWRRALRILPIYFFVVTAVGAYHIFVKGNTELLNIWGYYYLFLSNFLTEQIPGLTIMWSLAVEEQFYMIWPLALLLLPRKWIVPALIVLIAANYLGSLGGYKTSELFWGPLHFHLPITTYAPILMGALIAIILHSPKGFTTFASFLGNAAAVPLVFLGLALSLHFTPALVSGWPNMLIHTMMCLCLMAILVRPRNVFTGVFENRLVARIGEISYGIYLYHLIALDIAYKGLLRLGYADYWLLFFTYCLLSVVIAEISFRTLERFFQSFRDKGLGRTKPAIA